MTKSRGLLPPAGTDLNQPCVVRDVVDRVGDRWSLLVLAHLGAEPKRFNALHRAIGDISKQVLSRTVRRLEEDGFVSRTIHAVNPPQVEYDLTEMGVSFLEPLKTLVGWAELHQNNIAKARETFRNSQNTGKERK